LCITDWDLSDNTEHCYNKSIIESYLVILKNIGMSVPYVQCKV
jgi:hypothetical protein